MLRIRLLACACLLLAAGPATRARGEESEPGDGRLELKDLFGEKPFEQPIPRWEWRPGHLQLVRMHSPKPKGEPADAASPAEGEGGTEAAVDKDEATRGEETSGGDEGKQGKQGEAAKGKREKKPPLPLELEAMDPATGETFRLLDLRALDALVPGKGRPMRGIGRAGPPRYAWSKDGKALCAVVKGDLVWVDLVKGTKRRLTETEQPLADLDVAPDASHVSFSCGNELWVASTTEGRPYPLTEGGSKTLLNATLDWVYPEEFGFSTATWWAPDSKHVAYLQMDEAGVPVYRVPGLIPKRSPGREMFYPKAGDPNPRVRIGIVPVGGGKTVWMDLGDPAPEYVVRVSWTPDSENLLVVTLDRAQRCLQLFACDPESGASKVVHTERDDAWISPPPTPRWVDDHHFLWKRQTDCTRWYLAAWPPKGEFLAFSQVITPTKLDAGDLLHYDPKTGKRWFTGVKHGEVKSRVFAEWELPDRGITVSEVQGPWYALRPDPTGTYALASRSGAVEPGVEELIELADGEIVRLIGESRTDRLDAVDLAVPEYGSIPLEGSGGRIHWRLWRPADFDPTKRYGLIVHTYAGPGSRMVRDRWGRGPLLITLLTQRGFLVLQADGRGTGGQGRDFMKAVQGKLGILELEDQVRAVREICKRPYVDPKRVGIWGWSYGGTMTCNALTMRSDVFAAGVAVAPVTDWRLYDTIYTERYMGTPQENPEGYKETASVLHAKKMKGRLLLMHGLGDDNVHAQNTMRLIEAFIRARNLNYDAMIYPRRGHGIGGATLDVFTRLVRHFETHIGE